MALINMRRSKEFVNDLRRVRQDIWYSMPSEISRLTSKRGFLLPAAAIIYSEGETRNLHELLWILHCAAHERRISLSSLKDFTSALLSHYHKKLDGWYDLKNLAAALKKSQDIMNHIKNREEYLSVLKELMLYVGRINMWIDLLIPWHEVNKIFLQNPKS